MQVMDVPLWSSFKTIVSGKALLMQFAENADYYEVYAPEAQALLWHVSIPKDSGSDQTDFETHFKSTINQPLEIKSGAGRPGRVSASPQPIGTSQRWKGYQVSLDATQTTNYVDVSFPSTVYFRGGMALSADCLAGDTLTAQVLVAANNAVVSTIVDGAFILPGHTIDLQSDESMAFPTSVKIRITLAGVVGTARTANILVDYYV